MKQSRHVKNALINLGYCERKCIRKGSSLSCFHLINSQAVTTNYHRIYKKHDAGDLFRKKIALKLIYNALLCSMGTH